MTNMMNMTEMDLMIVQVTAAFIGSFGFAFFLKMRTRQAVMAAVGGGITWALYLLLAAQLGGQFLPNLLASIFVGIYAEIMARVNRAPATVFLTTAAVPLIPGGNLYYTMLGLVQQDEELFAESGTKALTIALAIALGFVTVAVANNFYLRLQSERQNSRG